MPEFLNTLVARQSEATAPYDWILAITFIAYIFSAFGNGANDVANAYATSVAARTLTMVQVGFLAVLTEFFGAVVVRSSTEEMQIYANANIAWCPCHQHYQEFNHQYRSF